MSSRDEWNGMYQRLRFEALDFAERAAKQRLLAIEQRKKRRFVEALVADSRAREYRDSRDARLSQAREIKRKWNFK